VRSLLVQVAVSIRRVRHPATIALRDWAERLAARRGRFIAVVAVARRLAGILYALFRDGTRYLQEWVKAKGLKVCIVFEGRDGAGKGGVIKAITERVSPRVFRVVALPAPTERRNPRCTRSGTYPIFPRRARS
jgi:hypothetical protein